MDQVFAGYSLVGRNRLAVDWDPHLERIFAGSREWIQIHAQQR